MFNSSKFLFLQIEALKNKKNTFCYFDLEDGETGTLRKFFGRHDVPVLYPYSRTNDASTNGTDLYECASQYFKTYPIHIPGLWKHGPIDILDRLKCWPIHILSFDFLYPFIAGCQTNIAVNSLNTKRTSSLEKSLSEKYVNIPQSSRKRRIRRIFTPIFAFVHVKFPSEDSHLRFIATGRPNWTSKTYRGLPVFLLSVEIDTRDVQKLSKSPPTFNELYDVCPAYLLEIRYLCWLSFKDVPFSACGSFIDIGVKRRGTLLMAAWSLYVFIMRAELINVL